jgi:hypothetical protein
VAQVQGSGADLEQQRRHEKEIVPAHQYNLDFRSAPAEFFQVSGRVQAAKAATEDDNPRRPNLSSVSRRFRPVAQFR